MANYSLIKIYIKPLHYTDVTKVLNLESVEDQDWPGYIPFEAYVTNYKDSYSQKWNSDAVFGRMDRYAVFKNTERKISLSLDVPAYDVKSASINLTKLQALIKAQYPVYQENNNATSISTSPVFRMKFANWTMNAINDNEGLAGYFDGIDFEPDIKMGYFISKNQDIMLPKNYKINLSFNVLHEHNLGVTVVENDLIDYGTEFPFETDWEYFRGEGWISRQEESLDSTTPTPEIRQANENSLTNNDGN